MTNRSDVRRLLWQWGRVMDFCRSRQKEIEEFQQRLIDCANLSAQVLDGMPHGGGISDPTQRSVLKIESLMRRYEETIERIKTDIDEELNFKEMIDAALKKLTFEKQKIIEMRYQKKHKWIYIARMMCFSEESVRKKESRAMDELYTILRN